MVFYWRTTSASTAPCTARRICCPTHCASYCAPRQPLVRAFFRMKCEHFSDGFVEATTNPHGWTNSRFSDVGFSLTDPPKRCVCNLRSPLSRCKINFWRESWIGPDVGVGGDAFSFLVCGRRGTSRTSRSRTWCTTRRCQLG